RVLAVPPVDRISAPSAASPFARSTTPVLSETLINARFMLAMRQLVASTRVNDERRGRIAEDSKGGGQVQLGCPRLGQTPGWLASVRVYSREVQVMLAIEWLMRMERSTILGGGVFALALLALVCIPRHLPLSASPPVPVPANFHARLEQGTLMLRGSLPDAGARDRILERARAAFGPAQVRVLDQLTI